MELFGSFKYGFFANVVKHLFEKDLKLCEISNGGETLSPLGRLPQGAFCCQRDFAGNNWCR